MPGNSFGHAFRITTWGESHGPGIGVVIDGCPPGLEIRVEDIQIQLDRRRPGQSRLTTQRREQDQVRILSGVEKGVSLGTPIALWVENLDQRPQDYASVNAGYRPSHADMTYDFKYGVQAGSGGGRASARETIGRVAAGAIAALWLERNFGVEIVAWVSQVHDVCLESVDFDRICRESVEGSLVRCPDPETGARMIDAIEAARRDRDSVGGIIEAVARGCPAGWGEPVFDKLDALLAHAFMSIPAVKGVEIGSGFRGVGLRGSQHNDEFFLSDGEVRTRSNFSGGIQGGISNGMPISCRIAFKPTATINKPQRTVSRSGEAVTLEVRGRHDPCVLPRAVPIVEAMMALVLIDLALQDRGQMGSRSDDLRPRVSMPDVKADRET